MAIPEKTTKGPGGMLGMKLANRTPEKALIAPKIELNKAYLNMSELKFFAAIAGTTTKKPTSRVPTILIPTATTVHTRKRYRRFVLATSMPFEMARSSEIIAKTSLLYIERVKR